MVTQPNILLLMVDAMRADRTWGSRRSARTPFLDGLVKRSTVFTRAFSTASITTVCTTSLLTGCYPFVHGIHSLLSNRLRTDLPTLPELLKAGGYHTWAEMTGPLEAMRGLDRGFDRYEYRPYDHWLDTEWGDGFIRRLRDGADFPAPWFGLLHLWELHNPRRVTPGYDHRSAGETLYDRAVSSLDAQLARLFEALPENTIVVLTGDHGEYVSASQSGEIIARLKAPWKWIKEHIPGARRLRRFTPAAVKGMERLSSNNKDFHFGWLGHGYHVYDYLTHVPLLMYGPGLFPEGHKIDELVSHVDVLPTLLSALGLEGAPATLNGIDLMPLVRGEISDLGDRALYLEALIGMHERSRAGPEYWLGGIRTWRYKYARGLYNPELPEELYDLEADPAEEHNVIDRLPQVAAEMRARFQEMTAGYSDEPPEEGQEYTPEELALIEQRLQDLGYIE